jgi:hypothetical protein
MTQAFWITKYALTQGIIQKDLLVTEDGKHAYSPSESGEHWFLAIGKECFQVLEEAQAVSEEMRMAKVKSLEKQIQRLKNMDFGDQANGH